MAETPAHDQTVSNRYTVHYPAHEPRESDPHYAAFNVYRRANVATAVCWLGKHVGFDECADAQGKPIPTQPNGGHGLELHHAHIEFALVNNIDLAALQEDYPFLKDAEDVDKWSEGPDNFMWLCAKHHRGVGGAHHAAYADFCAELYVRGLIG